MLGFGELSRFKISMCDIVGYIGGAEAVPILLRMVCGVLNTAGHDSAGLATINGGGIEVRKTVGRIADLSQVISASSSAGQLGMSHARWAAISGVTQRELIRISTPASCLVLVHNGVIENYLSLRAQLEEKGHVFQSQTDTEVLAHLDRRGLRRRAKESASLPLVEAVRESLRQVIGTYGIAVILCGCARRSDWRAPAKSSGARRRQG